jgi:hypothetical protein
MRRLECCLHAGHRDADVHLDGELQVGCASVPNTHDGALSPGASAAAASDGIATMAGERIVGAGAATAEDGVKKTDGVHEGAATMSGAAEGTVTAGAAGADGAAATTAGADGLAASTGAAAGIYQRLLCAWRNARARTMPRLRVGFQPAVTDSCRSGRP